MHDHSHGSQVRPCFGELEVRLGLRQRQTGWQSSPTECVRDR
jgi:hypothetical protein